MRTAYFNCSSGIAGDMTIAALMDAFSVAAAPFERRLKGLLKFKGFGLAYTTSNRYHAPCKHLDVTGSAHFHSPREIHRLIAASTLPATVKGRSLKVLNLLVAAEAAVHNVKKGQVHFHELNSVDTLIDITAPLLLLHDHSVDSVLSSPLNIGNPAPATLEIVRTFSIPVHSSIATHELTTPTGSALISVLADSFGAMPPMNITHSGISCGTMDIPAHRNVLKVLIGSATGLCAGDEVVQLSTNIDDMDPRVYPYVMEKLLAAGALDVWLEQVLMKKGRPGVVLNVLCGEKAEAESAAVIFKETTTLGIRRQPLSRYTLARNGDGTRKTSFLDGTKRSARIEYEKAKKLAVKTGRPLRSFLD
jgi:uncharacterized protein (TIGR00299 family) protein